MDIRGFDELVTCKIPGKLSQWVGTELDEMVLREELISEAFVMKCITPHAVVKFSFFIQ